VTGGPEATTANVWAHEVKVAGRATGKQLRLLVGAESHVRAVTRGTFDVICSP
jgi:hypothetical protein